jgi:1,4-dihydroxy-2-naphthoyl-CoA hydrolase
MFFNYKNITLEALNKRLENTMASYLGMEVIEIGESHLTMKMPVDHRTIQPMGLLNGGASMALAETVGSMAANLTLDGTKVCVGLEINGNHLKGVKKGFVYGKATPIHTGRQTHVWQVNISDDDGNLVCTCRITVLIIDIPVQK